VGSREDAGVVAWAKRLIGELVASGALAREGERLRDA
jgi:hypothetical protein